MPARATITRRFKRRARWAMLQTALVALLCAGAAQAQSFSAGPVLFPATGDNGQAPQPVNITLTAPSTIRSITIPIPLAAVPEFTLVDNGGCVEDGTTVNATGTVCSLVVRFHPAYAGIRTATLVVTDGAGRSAAIPISGTGYYPQIAVFPAATRIVAGLGPSNAAATGDGDAAVLATLNAPRGIATDSFGNLYIADTGNNVVRMLDAFGNITTVAGGGTTAGAAGDGGLATAASLASPSWLAVDAAGNLYITETGSHVIRRVAMSSSRTITTVAGSYVAGSSGDGYPATAAKLNAPTGIAVDPAGNLYIADAGNFRIRRVDAATGYITAFAGTGSSGFNASSTPAASAQFSTLAGLALDVAGNLFVADAGNHAVREVAGGSVTVVAGTGVAGSSADGTTAVNANLGDPEGIAVTPSGDVFFTDATAGLVRKVRSADGTLQTIVATAGKSNGFTSGVRPSNNVSLHTPLGLTFDSRFTLYIADSTNNVVRALSPAPGELDFAAQAVGNTSSPMTVRIVNIGNVGLTLASVSAANSTTSSNFTLNTATAEACGTALDPAALCSFTVAFSPSASGSVTGEFDIGYHPPSNAAINLSAPLLVSGGTLTSLALSPGSLSPFSQGQAATVAITATGYFGTVALDTEGTLPPGLSASISQNVLTLSGTPTAAGAFPFTVFATDSLGATTAQAYTLQVLPITITLNVAESIHVSDAAIPILSLSLNVNEAIHVADVPKELLPAVLAVSEAIHITDTPREALSLLLNVSEAIHVTDAATQALALFLNVNEAIHVSDIPRELLPALLAVAETIHVTDAPKEVSSLLLNVGESIHVTDTPKETLPLALLVNEAIRVSDAPRTAPQLALLVREAIHIADVASGNLSLNINITESVRVSDIEAGAPSLLSTATESIHVRDSVALSVSKQSQTITAPGIPAHTYGDASFNISASSDSGLPVAVAVQSGPASVSGSTIRITGAGAVTLLFTQSGNDTYQAAPDVTRTFTVSTASAAVRAADATRSFATGNPAFTFQISGLVNGDTAASLNGSPALSTTATFNSPAGAYPIHVAQGTLSSPNYTFTTIAGTLNITGGAAQTITFGQPPNVPLAVNGVTLTARASSGLTVSYTVSGPATVSKNKVTFTGAGTITVTATQAGDGTYAAAPSVVRTLQVTP